MKPLLSQFVVVVLILVCGQTVTAQLPPAPQQPKLPPLQLTTKLLDAHYCKGSADADILQMRLRLRYENKGTQKIILYQGNNIFYQTRIRSIPQASDAKPYEVTILNSRFLNYQPEKFSEAGPGKEFVILSPGNAYETEMTVGVGVFPHGANRPNSAITEGEHSLNLIVSTWYESAKLAETLRQRWQRKGFLWYTPIISTPVSLNVEKIRQTVKCR